MPGKQYKQIVGRVLDLTVDPALYDARKFHGFDGARIDVGEHCVVYRFDEDEAAIVVVGKRNDDEVYRQLRRLD